MSIKIEQISIDEIKPYEKNPRNNDNAVDKVATSIKQFGFKVPIIIDKNNVIVAGHTRYKAAQKLNLNLLPCIVTDDLTDEQIKAFRLADNKVAEFSEWDFDLLKQELLDLENFDLDMSEFGFNFDLESDEEQTEVIEDEIPQEVESVAKLGDIWQLGNHRVMCGDSTSITDLQKLMSDEKADMVFTDPPYGMKKEKDGVANDNLNYDDLLEFNRQWIPLSFDALKDTGAWYCWGIDEPLMDIYSEILKPMKKKNEIVIRNYITWAKHIARGINCHKKLSYPKETEKCWFVIKGRDWENTNAEYFDSKFEKILGYMQEEANRLEIGPKDIYQITGVQMYKHWFSKSQFLVIPEKHYKELQKAYPDGFKKTYEDLKVMIGQSEKCLRPYFDNVAKDRVGDIGLTDVWRFSVTNGEEKESAGGHATPKPIALCSRAINASTRKNEIVLDVFGGSGSTLIACEQLNRQARLMELEPKWVDVIIKRWENFTGSKAVLLN